MTQQEKIAQRLAEAREAAGKTQADAAKYLGVTYQAISNWERAYSKIDSVSLLKLLSFYDVNVYDFMESCDFVVMNRSDGSDYWLSEDAREVADAYSLLPSLSEKNMVRKALGLPPVGEGAAPAPVPSRIIPLLGTSAAAGPGEFDTGLPWLNYDVPADSRADFAVKISGDSMEPVLHDGDVALCREKGPEPGDVAVVMVNGSLVVKQFIPDCYGNIYLRSLNRGRKDADIDIMADGNNTVAVYGIVDLKRRPPLVDQ